MKIGKIAVLIVGSLGFIGLFLIIFMGRKSADNKVLLSTARSNKLTNEAMKRIGNDAEKIFFNEKEELMVAMVPGVKPAVRNDDSAHPAHYCKKLIILKNADRKSRALLTVTEDEILDENGQKLLAQTHAGYGYICTFGDANKTPSVRLQIVDSLGAPISDELTLLFDAKRGVYVLDRL